MLIHRIIVRSSKLLKHYYDTLLTHISFKGYGVRYGSFNTYGRPWVMVARGGKMSIGKNFKINNGITGNPIGYYERCTFFVDRDALLTIGNNVGMSQTALIAMADITIEDNVKIGGGVKIYTSDFHSLYSETRKSPNDMKHRVDLPVIIKENAFIGAGSMILKGVTVGRNSIIGAGSVVTKNIPDDEVWAGNPAKFIRKVE